MTPYLLINSKLRINFLMKKNKSPTAVNIPEFINYKKTYTTKYAKIPNKNISYISTMLIKIITKI